MNPSIHRVASTVEIDKSALMRALSIHLQISATVLCLEPFGFEIDPIDQLPDVNQVAVSIDGAKLHFEISHVQIGKYCNLDYVLLEMAHTPTAGRDYDTYVLYRDFGGQPQFVLRVDRDLVDVEEDEKSQLIRDIINEFYKSE